MWEAGTSREGAMVRLLQTSEAGHTLEPQEYEIRAGKITITLPKTSGTIIKFHAAIKEPELKSAEKQEKARGFFRKRFIDW